MTQSNNPPGSEAPGFGAFLGADTTDNSAPKKTTRKTKRGSRSAGQKDSDDGAESSSGDDSGSTRKTTRKRSTRKKAGSTRSEKTDANEAPSEERSSRSEGSRSRRGRSRSTSESREASGDTQEQGEDRPREMRTRRRGRRSAGADDSAESSASPSAGEATSSGDQDEGRSDGRRGGRGSREGRRRSGRSADQETSSDQTSERTEDSASSETRDESPDSGTRRGRGRGRSRRKPRTDSETVSETENEDRQSDQDEDSSEAGSTRRKRGGRRRSSSSRSVVEEASAETSEAEPRNEDGEDDAPKRRNRGSRGSRGGRSKTKKVVTRREKPGAAVVEFIPGEEDDLPALPDLPDEAELLNEDDLGEEPSRSDRGRRKRGTASETSISPARRTTVKPDRKILVNACDQEEIRVAVVKDGKILDFQMNVESDTSLVNDIYRGRIVNIEHSIGAAFVDFGRGRNGFLHTSDVLPSYAEKGLSLSKLLATDVDPEDWDSGSSPPSVAEEMDHDDHDEDEDEGDDDSSGSEGDKGSTTKDKKPEGRGRRGPAKGKGRGDKGKQKHFRARPRRPIDELFKVGQKVVVQITKDAIGDKGPTLTTYLSIPGRYLVLMPSISHCGVSRKIEDSKERKRLKRILDSLNVPEGMGIIARTATMGHTKAEIKRDLDYLLSAWNQLASRLDKGHGPTALYQESDVAIRTVRDLFGPETEAVIVDEPETYKSIRDFAELLMPEHADRIVEHDGSRPLFHAEGVEQDFEKIFSRRIELPSGGSIVFDQAEALVAIDVNSGKTRTASHDFEEIALKTNMEAVPEIARQIRLRDLGGIIVVDFIDMMKNSNRKGVEQTFRGRFSDDRARSKVGRISQFGLLEMTRQRLGPGMSKKLFRPCVACRGAGRQRTESSRSAAILRRLGSALTLKGFTTVELKAHPETIEYLKKVRTKELEALEESSGRKLELKSVPDQLEDSVLRYLRTDGREVRPGGRRKR